MQEKDILLHILERFETLENTLVASEEYLASIRYLMETQDTQFFAQRMYLTTAGSNGKLVDEYNDIGKDTRCLVPDSKLMCLELLRNEWIEN